MGITLLAGCGGGGTSTSTSLDDTTNTGTTDPSEENTTTEIKTGITISGNVTYDRVPVNSDGIGLDYDNITQEKVKNAIVDLVNASNTTIDSTTTDSNGYYAFNDVATSTNVKIRVYAKMLKTGAPAWDVKVVDNTNSDSIYVMEGAYSTSGTTNSTRDLNAPSGWGASSYTSTRTAAPFAILDDVYYAMQRVLSADAQAAFPELQVNWSVKNVSVSGDTTQGQISTSHYTNSNLYILGDADSDTDEYDNHVITHEWGHYYEDKFSRSDSIGGSHGSDELLDIRVAFSEGWGNAFSAMALDDPLYYDTQDSQQSSGFNFNVEKETHSNAGWYSESSIQRILYDLYDAHNDSNGNDNVSLGFTPIHDVFTGAEKVTPAFTSIFPFITILKSENNSESSAIDSIVSSESIATITDIYGTGRTNKSSAYPYKSLTMGSSVSVILSNTDGSYNKLSNRKYVRFTVSTSGTYTIKVQQTNGTDSDLDFYLYKTAPFSYITFGESSVAGSEEQSITLSAGSYILDIADYNEVSDAHLTVTVN